VLDVYYLNVLVQIFQLEPATCFG